jgi:tRNA G37 N-methylase TrmD
VFPKFCLSGNHEKNPKIGKNLNPIEATANRRPDLLNNVKLTKKQKKLLEDLSTQSIL